MKIIDAVCKLISAPYPLLLTDGTTLLPSEIASPSAEDVEKFKTEYGELHHVFEHPSLSLLQINLRIVLTKLVENTDSVLVEISLISDTSMELPHFTYEKMFEESDFSNCADFDASFTQWITNSTFALIPLAHDKFDSQLDFASLNPWVAESMINLLNEVDDFNIQKKIEHLNEDKKLLDRRLEALEIIKSDLEKEKNSISISIKTFESMKTELWI